MNEIIYTASFGFQTRHVEISQPVGAMGSWYVMVDNRYWGSLTKTEHFGWTWGFRKGTVTGDDIRAIIEVIEENSEG